MAASLRDRAHASVTAALGLTALRPLRVAVVVVLLAQTFAILALRPCYETNDDVFMTMIASGTGICTSPDEHLVFTNITIGHLLSCLYTWAPTVPWYGCYLFSIHFAAQVALLYCVLTAGRTSLDQRGGDRLDRAGDREDQRELARALDFTRCITRWSSSRCSTGCNSRLRDSWPHRRGSSCCCSPGSAARGNPAPPWPFRWSRRHRFWWSPPACDWKASRWRCWSRVRPVCCCSRTRRAAHSFPAERHCW